MREIEASAKPLTDAQRGKFLELMGSEPNRSTREALRLAGYTAASSSLAVTKADVKALFAADPDLYADMRRAQKRNLEPIEGRVYAIALDEKNGRSLDAAKFLLERRHPDYAQTGRVEVSGPEGGPIEIEDRSASLAAVAEILARVGALPAINGSGTPRHALPAAPALLPEPPNR